jgi:hypothetical protein
VAKCAAWLVERGCSVFAQNSKGDTPLHLLLRHFEAAVCAVGQHSTSSEGDDSSSSSSTSNNRGCAAIAGIVPAVVALAECLLRKGSSVSGIVNSDGETAGDILNRLAVLAGPGPGQQGQQGQSAIAAFADPLHRMVADFCRAQALDDVHALQAQQEGAVVLGSPTASLFDNKYKGNTYLSFSFGQHTIAPHR